MRKGPLRDHINVGTVFGTSVYITDVTSEGRRKSLFRCKCGKEFIARTSHVISGNTYGCGCSIGNNLRKLKKQIKHGYAKDRKNGEYAIWNAMRDRCANPKNQAYKRYGGRGIRVHNTWQMFETFIKDMGPRPSMDYSLDRINNDGNYEPGNVRWALQDQQSANRSDNRWIEHNGKTLPLFLWAREVGVPASVIHKRIKRGWSIERAFTPSPETKVLL